MGIGVSILLIAVGAILTWAVNATVSGLELNTIGVILMVVGALGLVLSMIFWSSWGGFATAARAARRRTSTTARASSAAASLPFEREAACGPPLLVQASGSSNENVEPRPGSDSTRIRPPIRRTSSREM